MSELKRLAPAAGQKMLVQQLRELEAHGLITRTLFAEVPPRVEDKPTTLGASFQPILLSLCEWGRTHAAELEADPRTEDCLEAEPSDPRR